MDDIHRARIGLKRIKAVNRLLRFTYHGNILIKGLNKVYNPVFRQLGVYREGWTNARLLKHYRCPVRLRRVLTDSINLNLSCQKQGIREAVSNFDSEKVIRQNIAIENVLNFMEQEKEVAVICDYIESELKKISGMLIGNNTNVNLHSTRIVLKNIKPFLSLLWPMDYNQYTHDDYRKLNRAETLIGDWHDRHMLSIFLDDSIRRGDLIMGEDAKTARKFLERLSLVNTNLLKQFMVA